MFHGVIQKITLAQFFLRHGVEVIAVKLEKGITPGSPLFFNPWTIPKVSKLLLLLLLLHDKKSKTYWSA